MMAFQKSTQHKKVLQYTSNDEFGISNKYVNCCVSFGNPNIKNLNNTFKALFWVYCMKCM